MSAIQGLPEEILRLIVNELDRESLLTCAYVMRAWYSSLMVALLPHVILVDDSCIKSFIAFIDNNSSPTYTNAVIEVVLDLCQKEVFHIDSYYVSKLFLRFRNLQHIWLGSTVCIKGMNEEHCKSILTHCPGLECFTVSFGPRTGPEEMYRVRSLLTSVEEPDKYTPRLPRMDLIKYLCSFPRLQSNLNFYSTHLGSLQQVVCIMEKLEHLTEISLKQLDHDDNFVERYIASKPKETQYLLFKRLAKVQELDLGSSDTICPYSVNFIAKYMTGIQRVTLESNDDSYWSMDERKHYYSSELMDILQRCRFFDAKFKFMTLRFLSECFGVLVKKLFVENDRSKRINRFSLTISGNGGNHLSTCQGFNFTELSVHVQRYSFSLSDIATYLFVNRDAFDTVSIRMEYSQFIYCFDTDLRSHNTIMESLPFVENLRLEIPNTVTEVKAPVKGGSREVHNEVFPNLKDLTIRAAAGAKFGYFLHKHAVVSPSLRNLTLENWAGLWEADIGEFRIKLPKYSLENLYVDAGLMVRTAVSHLEKQDRLTKESFFVLQVETLSTDLRKRFKILFNDGSLSSTTINDGDLKGHTIGKDYFRMNITILNLQNLVLSYIDKTTLTKSKTTLNIQDA
jgi:hypothetical protein